MTGLSSQRRILSKISAGSILAIVVAACGGGGDSGAAGGPFGGIDAGGTPVRFFTAGPISGFGSIILDGIEYDTSRAQIIVDGVAGDESVLAVGQIVAVGSSLDGATRTAARVEFDENVEGPVEAAGNQLAANGELISSRVAFKDNDLDDRIHDQTQIEIKGLITRFVSVTDLDVAGFTVTSDNRTQFRGGTAADLALNVRVDADGRLDAQRRLLASEIEFKDDGDVEIDALVDNVDAAANRLSMLGIRVELSAITRIEDKSGTGLRPFSINDIDPGDRLKIRGTESGPGTVASTRVERDDPEAEAKIRGTASNVADPTFQILGLDIDTDAATRLVGVTRADFFATAEGRLVQADGNLNGGRFLARQVEFEDIN